MTRFCLLHVGMMKTGSTSIQHSLRHYDDGTMLYPEYGRFNHSALLRNVALERPRPQLMDVAREFDSDQFSSRAEAHRALFGRVLAQHDSDIVLSAEELTSSFSRRTAETLIGLLRPHFDRIRMIGYVRNPFAFMKSILPKRTKIERTTFDIESLYPNYRRLFWKWVEPIGRKHCELVRFSPSTLDDGDVITDFVRRIGADEQLLTRPKGRLNESLSAEAFAVLYLYRQVRGEPRRHPVLARENARVVRQLRFFGDRKVDLDRDATARVLDSRRGDIEWVEQLIGTSLDLTLAPPTDDAAVFSNEDDVIELAHEVASVFGEFVAGRNRPVADDASAVEAMDALYGFEAAS